MAWDLPGVIVNAVDRTAAYFNKYKSCFDALSLHAHGGSDGDGATLTETFIRRDNFLFIPLGYVSGNFVYSANGLLGSVENTTPALNNQVTWSIQLEPGSYEVNVLHDKGSSHGIATFYMDGIAFGTIDGYSASSVTNQFETLSVEIGDVPQVTHTMQIVMASKNALSSNYRFILVSMGFVMQ